MLVIAGVGFVVNTAATLLLKSHAHNDLNMKSAYLHLLTDARIARWLWLQDSLHEKIGGSLIRLFQLLSDCLSSKARGVSLQRRFISLQKEHLEELIYMKLPRIFNHSLAWRTFIIYTFGVYLLECGH